MSLLQIQGCQHFQTLMSKSRIGSMVADLCIVADGLYSLFIEVVSSMELILYALLQLSWYFVSHLLRKEIICRLPFFNR